jgi:starvation-inducible DNA-binding protein
MKPNIGIPEKNLKNTSLILSAMLSAEMILYVKTRKAHWNVTGGNFMEFHKLFESQYKLLEESIDEIAERIGKLGEKTIGTMQEYLNLSSIKERPGKYASSKEMLTELLEDHETISLQLRKNIEECAEKNKDAGTADFLTRLLEEHETMAWVLRRYLS